jgi:hypothetical protein
MLGLIRYHNPILKNEREYEMIDIVNDINSVALVILYSLVRKYINFSKYDISVELYEKLKVLNESFEYKKNYITLKESDKRLTHNDELKDNIDNIFFNTYNLDLELDEIELKNPQRILNYYYYFNYCSNYTMPNRIRSESEYNRLENTYNFNDDADISFIRRFRVIYDVSDERKYLKYKFKYLELKNKIASTKYY